MTEELQKTIKEQIESLPKEAQEAIKALDWVKIAEEIGKKYSLSDEEIEDFQLETLLVLVGAVDIEFYAVNIENHVNTTKEQSEAMAKEAVEKILVPIRDAVEEKIKNRLQKTASTWAQTVDFILSGGDYGVYLEEPEVPKPTITFNTAPSQQKIEDIKKKFVI